MQQAKQVPTTELESYFLSCAKEDFPRILDYEITPEQIADATYGKYSTFSKELKQEYNLGIVTKTGVPQRNFEINLVKEEGMTKSLTTKQQEFRKKLDLVPLDIIVLGFDENSYIDHSDWVSLLFEAHEKFYGIEQD